METIIFKEDISKSNKDYRNMGSDTCHNAGNHKSCKGSSTG